MVITRFTKTLLILMAVFIGYSLVIGLSLPSSDAYWKYYIIGMFLFLLNVSVLGGNFTSFKSDADFLFVLPLKRNELSAVIYIVRFLGTGIVFFLFFGYAIPSISGGLTDKLAVAGDIVLLGMLVTSLSSVATGLNFKLRAGISAFMSVWALSPLLGFNYSYTSMLWSSVKVGTIILVALIAPLTVFALRSLDSLELGNTRRRTFTGDAFRGSLTFENMSPYRAAFMLNLRLVNISGRSNPGGSSNFSFIRARMRTFLMADFILLVIYILIILKIRNLNATDLGGVNPIVTLITGYIVLFSLAIFSQGSIMYERLWLSLISVPPMKYLKTLIAAKVSQVMIIFAPFIAADVVFYFMGVGSMLGAAMALAFIAPSSVVIFFYVTLRVNPIQIKEEGFLPARFSGRQMLQSFPIVLSFVGAMVSTVSVLVAAAVSAIFIVAAVAVLFSKGIWKSAITRLTESGFV